MEIDNRDFRTTWLVGTEKRLTGEVEVDPVELFINACENDRDHYNTLVEVFAVAIEAAGDYGKRLFDESGDFLPEVWRLVREMGIGQDVRRGVRRIRREEPKDR